MKQHYKWGVITFKSKYSENDETGLILQYVRFTHDSPHRIVHLCSILIPEQSIHPSLLTGFAAMVIRSSTSCMVTIRIHLFCHSPYRPPQSLRTLAEGSSIRYEYSPMPSNVSAQYSSSACGSEYPRAYSITLKLFRFRPVFCHRSPVPS